MASNNNAPIVVNGQTLPGTLAAALRYLIAMVGTFAVARGWVDTAAVDGISTVIVTIATVVYGLWKTRNTREKLVTAAEAAPNSVAIVK